MAEEDRQTDVAVDNTLRNQFYFSDRGSQTFNALIRERSVATEAAPTTRYNDTVSSHIGFDLYMADINRASAAEAENEGGTSATGGGASAAAGGKTGKSDTDPLYSETMRRAMKIMERMTNLNTDAEIYLDYKYWEDEADKYRDGDGTLLPLWRFTAEKAKRKQVTCISWNSKYKDLFAVGFGSYEYLRQSSGCVCVFTLKNTKSPEFQFPVDSGVCSLDWHPTEASLLAVGCYDGGVLVYDVRSRSKKPVYAASARNNRHTDPVWQVKWSGASPTADGVPSFFSVSADGRVSTWKMMKNKLESEDVLALKLVGGPGEAGANANANANAGGPGPGAGSGSGSGSGAGLAGLASGLCFDFNPFNAEIFLVGTEEGKIHKCSRNMSDQYLMSYPGHTMAVYSVKWNSHHKHVFLSASADWSVKVWHAKMGICLLNFDLQQAVGDAAWAPYSSTVFAATTADGVVHFFDLNVNRNERILYQKVVKKAKLTHVSFSPKEAVILVGDDRGATNCLKLSPNLRIVSENEDQIKKMERIIDMVVEPHLRSTNNSALTH